MEEMFSRCIPLLGSEGLNRLAKCHIAVFGIGGVGGHAAEALARSGVKKIDLIDGDVVSVSNLNRQIIALTSTLGRPKAEVMRERILDINPSAEVRALNLFFSAENSAEFDFSAYDYIIDAIDTVSSKIELISCAQRAGVKIISSMGAGNKLDPTKFEVSDIYKTSVCPLARAVRTELRRRGIKGLKVVYSKEEPSGIGSDSEPKKRVPASLAFVPSVAGLIIAGEVIKDIALDACENI